MAEEKAPANPLPPAIGDLVKAHEDRLAALEASRKEDRGLLDRLLGAAAAPEPAATREPADDNDEEEDGLSFFGFRL